MVELLDYWGSDEIICDAARVSFNKRADNYTTEQNRKLLRYLIEHGHTSPFRHCFFRFRIQCPIYVERQLFKHQIGITVNSISGRYVDFSDSYTQITEWRKQSTNSKQGSEGLVELQDQCTGIESNVIEHCKHAYVQLLELGVSKEQARTILPLNLNTTFIWTGSLQAILHLFDLRLKPDAQKETQIIVQQMYNAIISIESQPFKNTLELWQQHGKHIGLD
jgi:thymidylate synthase (FAD)